MEMIPTVILAAVVGFSALSSCDSADITTRSATTTADLSQVKTLDLLPMFIDGSLYMNTINDFH